MNESAGDDDRKRKNGHNVAIEPGMGGINGNQACNDQYTDEN